MKEFSSEDRLTTLEQIKEQYDHEKTFIQASFTGFETSILE
jgi:hypothetical protein